LVRETYEEPYIILNLQSFFITNKDVTKIQMCINSKYHKIYEHIRDESYARRVIQLGTYVQWRRNIFAPFFPRRRTVFTTFRIIVMLSHFNQLLRFFHYILVEML